MKLNSIFTTLTDEESLAMVKKQLDSVELKYTEEGHKNSLTFIVPTPSGMDKATGLYAVGMSISLQPQNTWVVTGLFVQDAGDRFMPWDPKSTEISDTNKFKLFLYELDQNLTYGHLQWTGENLGFRDMIPPNEFLVEYLMKVITELCVAFALIQKWDKLELSEIYPLWKVTGEMAKLATLRAHLENKAPTTADGIDARPDTGEPEPPVDGNKEDKA